ncbi:unnamed protein product [Paramecium primaurelia]|uniref:Uncharacterized protein n=1 Tax=Paramecium primaurelia TaxID=5886 RepID=A0A8S1QC76_PARPR|nr:unnamed protein product [Paramecium primaurelia]
MDGNILELENLLIRLKNQIRAQQKIFWMIRQAYLINIEQFIIQEIILKLIFIKLINYQQIFSVIGQVGVAPKST